MSSVCPSSEPRLVLSVKSEIRSQPGTRFTGEITEQGLQKQTGKVIFGFKPHTHISYMKARQTCLVALRYDDAAASVSTDTVTHALQQPSHLETDLRVQRCTQKHTVWGFPDGTAATPAWSKDVATSLRKTQLQRRQWHTFPAFCPPSSTAELKCPWRRKDTTFNKRMHRQRTSKVILEKQII